MQFAERFLTCHMDQHVHDLKQLASDLRREDAQDRFKRVAMASQLSTLAELLAIQSKIADRELVAEKLRSDRVLNESIGQWLESMLAVNTLARRNRPSQRRQRGQCYVYEIRDFQPSKEH